MKPNIQAALDYSRNFATAKPNLGRTEKEHIEGLANLLERTALGNSSQQALLTAADERADVLEQEVERLNRVKLALKELAESRADDCSVYRQHLNEALTMAEKVRAACPGMKRKYLSDLIVHLYQNSDAALKPAEGVAMNNQIVPDAGDGMAPAFLVKHGAPGDVYRCPQHTGADCAMCGGGGFRAICNLTECHEYGCQGSGCSRKPGDMQPAPTSEA